MLFLSNLFILNVTINQHVQTNKEKSWIAVYYKVTSDMIYVNTLCTNTAKYFRLTEILLYY